MHSLGVDSNQIVHIEVQSIDPVNAPLKLPNNSTVSPKQKNQYKMPDVLTVRVESGNENENNNNYNYQYLKYYYYIITRVHSWSRAVI